MGSFANLSANLNLNIHNFSRNLRTASNQMNSFAAGLQGRTVDALRDVNRQTTAWGLNVKSVSRVVSGILISQAFYAMLQSIRSATSAVWEFTKQLEYAEIAYSNLFGNTQLATEFINVLKDFAAITPFTFKESESAAKRLLAYGIEYKNVMYVMQGVMSAAAAQGDSTKVESISRAIGQIYTYGKLMTAEVRQLTEAGIPVYDILQEKLGLTQEQLRNLGNEAIPASEAINALVDGINERFGNVFAASSKTITGIISNIKDNALMLFSGLFNPLTVMIKSALLSFGEFMFNLRELFELKGAGGVFEALFPPEVHETMRQFIANFQTLNQAVLRLFVALGAALKPVLEAVVRLFNAFTPILVMITNAISALILYISNNVTAMRWLTTALAAAATMWVVYKAKAVAAAVVTGVITGMSKALALLATMLTFVVRHPFWTLLIGLTGLIVGVSGGFGVLSDKVNGFFKSLTQFNGINPDKVLLPSQKERANDLDKFNQRLEGTSDAMDDLAGSTGKAAKAAKSLLSFDEVFKLNDPDEGSGAGSGIDTSGLEDMLSGLGGLGDTFIPEVPDFSEFMDNLMTGFLEPFKKTWEKIKANAATIMGTALGGIVGYVLGGPAGAYVGAGLGMLAGWIWETLADKLGVTPTQRIADAISAGFIGAVSGITQSIKSFGFMLTTPIASLGDDLIRALKDGLKFGILGIVSSLGVGLLANVLTNWLADEFELTEQDIKNGATGQTIGSIAGAIVGAIIGGPVGSLVGGALGQLAGAVVGTFWDTILDFLKNVVKKIQKAAKDAIKPFEGILDTISDWNAKTQRIFSDWWQYTSEGFTEWWTDTKEGFISWSTDTLNKVSSWWTDTKAGFSSWSTDTLSKLSKWWSDTKSGFSRWFSDTFSGLSDWLDDTVATFSDWSSINSSTLRIWWTDTKQRFSDWWSTTKSGLSQWASDTISGFSQWAKNTKEQFASWKQDTEQRVANWRATTVNTFTTWKADTEQRFTEWKTATVTTVTTWASDVVAKFNRWKQDVINAIGQWAAETITSFGNWVVNTKKTIEEWLASIKKSFSDWKDSVYKTITGFTYAALLAFTDWCTNTNKRFSDWFADTKKRFSDWTADTKKRFSDWTYSVKNDIDVKFKAIDNKIGEFLGLDVSISTFCKNSLKSIKDWASSIWDSISEKFSSAIEKIKEFMQVSSSADSTPTSSSSSNSSSKSSSTKSSSTKSSSTSGGKVTNSSSLLAHATGGIFNREHIARFAEGNKAEAIIPLENNTAMQPFVDAISKGIMEGLAPTFVQSTSSSSNLPPLYVGTLIADDRGIKELYKRFEIIQVQENARKGLA